MTSLVRLVRPVRLVRLAASATLALPLVLGLAGSAAASCVMPGPIDEAVVGADSVFVGTVASVANGNRWASVAVEEVWSGPDLAPVVEVRGGSDPGSASSIDRAYQLGTRYLFVVSVDGRMLSDNACSPTTPFAAEHARLRPANARQPIGGDPDPPASTPFDPATVVVPALVVVAAGLLVFGSALVARRRA